MASKISLLVFLALSAAVVLAEDPPADIDTRAPAATTLADCNCQCDSYSWVDQNGNTQGNCKSPDQTGGRWCYTHSRTCQDLQFSKNRLDQSGQRRGWSYEACATPPQGSPQCRAAAGGPQPQQPPFNNNNNNNRPPFNSNNNRPPFNQQPLSSSGGPTNINLISLLGNRDASNVPAEGEDQGSADSVTFEQ